MTTIISMLRGINVSGKNKILMAELKALYEQMKFADVTTHIQSGNVIFNDKSHHSIEKQELEIEKAILKTFGYVVPVINRRVEEMKNIIHNNPFLKDKEKSLDHLYITFLSKIPDQQELDSIKTFNQSADQFIIEDKHVFLYVPGGYGNTKLSNTFFEKKLKVKSTTRNWKTVNKLFLLAEEINQG